jgi:hypothetical protein
VYLTGTHAAKEDEMAEQRQPPGTSAPGAQDQRGPNKAKASDDDGVQGEGDYAASRRYRDELEEFVKTADINEAARQAAPKDQQEAKELADAEAKGRARKKT